MKAEFDFWHVSTLPFFSHFHFKIFQVNVPNKYEIHVRRNNLLLDSYRGVFVTVTNTELLRTRLWIVFDSETGLDYGGLQR